MVKDKDETGAEGVDEVGQATIEREEYLAEQAEASGNPPDATHEELFNPEVSQKLAEEVGTIDPQEPPTAEGR